MLYVNDLYASTNLIRASRAYDIGTGIIGKRLRETLCVIPIETNDTVEIGWIGLKGKTLITMRICRSACDCLTPI